MQSNTSTPPSRSPQGLWSRLATFLFWITARVLPALAGKTASTISYLPASRDAYDTFNSINLGERSSSANGAATRARHRYVAADTSGDYSAPIAMSGNVAVQIENDEDPHATVGRGNVVDPQALLSGQSSSAPSAQQQNGYPGAAGAPGSGGLPLHSRSHYRISRAELMKGLANRFVHSTGYIYFYGGMALASLLTVFISLIQDCPGPLFYSLELAINALLIAEVSVRGYAFGKQFWKSTFNVVDLFLVLLCAITLLVLFFSHDCSPYRNGPGRGGDGDDDIPAPGDSLPGHEEEARRGGRSEELFDSLILILRNGAQLVRLLSVVRRSSTNVTSRVPNIDLDDAQRYSLDLDLEEEGQAARQRMADGGDRGARGYGERQQLFNYNDEDEEL